MKITRVRLRELTGSFEHEGDFWEERLTRPIDVYPEHRADGPDLGMAVRRKDGRVGVTNVFVEIETDEGITGIGGPLPHEQAFVVDQALAPVILGEDPTANERLWDKMYRDGVHGRKGVHMMALSAVDCALWDLRGKWLGQPVFRLLGGPVRDAIPAYASTLGLSLDPDEVRKRVGEFLADGYTATKWFPRWQPVDGKSGMRKIVELAETIRDAAGPDVDFMFDAWMSWDVPYTVRISELIAHTEPRWIEEPVLPDMIEACAEIRSRSMVPISTGEHEYTRWGIKQLLDAEAMDVLQPDTYWAGGITEMMKIGALASAYGIPVIPHGHSVPANVHLSLAWPIPQVPYVEFLVKWQQLLQHFWKEPMVPVNGLVRASERPGMGMEIDPDKIESERYLSWERPAYSAASVQPR